MDTVERDFKKIKDEIYDEMEKMKDDSAVLKNLYKINNVDEELQEIIILLYSNYKSELDLLNRTQYVNVNKIVDANIKLLERLKILLNKQNNPKKGFLSNFTNVPNLVKIVGSIVVGIGTIVILREVFPESTDAVIHFFIDLFSTKTIIKAN